MLVALDAHYGSARRGATAAAVVFAAWDNSVPVAEYTAVVEKVKPYVPGQFFRRELPCLLAVIAKIREPIGTIIIDGHVTLGEEPGLGKYLFDAPLQQIPIFGVAKTRFRAAPAIEILRGRSASPLFVTDAGVSVEQAGENIRRMHGPHRTPTLLKRVDQLARQGGWK